MASNLLKEFKDRNHITHSFEDSNIERLLSFSMSYVESRCGEFDTESDNENDMLATELVLERTRYAYNESKELKKRNQLIISFEDSNIERLLSFSMSYVKSRGGEFDTESENKNDMRATELVWERTRYEYNESLKYFEDTFLVK